MTPQDIAALVIGNVIKGHDPYDEVPVAEKIANLFELSDEDVEVVGDMANRLGTILTPDQMAEQFVDYLTETNFFD